MTAYQRRRAGAGILQPCGKSPDIVSLMRPLRTDLDATAEACRDVDVELVMMQMLCRNRVVDFDKWKAVFDSYLEAQRSSGLTLEHMWRQVEEPNNVFFAFHVANETRAREFVNGPEAAKVGEASGVIDGEIYFVKSLTV